ncbi:hypothetical protein EV363DRAFT_1178073 [Boletus edulis]|nr:hypothetical protein EV363DRAFT_1178073 [Boletus edulis]
MAASQLELIDISLKVNGQNTALKAMEAGRSFVARSIRSKVPANCFVVTDAHSDALTGGLQWAGGVTSVQTAPATDVLAEFVGTTSPAANERGLARCP